MKQIWPTNDVIQQQVPLGTEIFGKSRPKVDRGQIHNSSKKMNRLDNLEQSRCLYHYYQIQRENNAMVHTEGLTRFLKYR